MTPPDVGSPRRFRTWMRRLAAMLVSGLGTLILVVTGVLWWRTEPAPSLGTDVAQQLATGTPAPLPDPAHPPAPARQPVQLTIPGIGVTARVVPTGVDGHGEFAVPSSADTVGWFQYGPGLGDPAGSVVLGGHVDDAATGPGAFFRLRQLTPGMELSVSADDGGTVTYQVVAREEYPKATINLVRYFTGTGAHRLTLITCGGPFDDTTHSHRDNVVITAVPE